MIEEQVQLHGVNRDNVAIVLVETRTPGNVGSIARVMVNMGFEDLRLVNPQLDHLSPEAKWMAHGSERILEKIKVFPDLQQAVADSCLLVASSHKKVRNSQQCFSARELGPKLIPYCVHNKISILFGRENHGLSNEEVNLCPWLVNVPSAVDYPSLNLSQAVMLVCYEIFMTSVSQPIHAMPKLVGDKSMEIFYNQVLGILNLAKFHHKNQEPDIFMGALRRIFGRTGLEERDLKVLYKLFLQFKNIAENSASPADPET